MPHNPPNGALLGAITQLHQLVQQLATQPPPQAELTPAVVAEMQQDLRLLRQQQGEQHTQRLWDKAVEAWEKKEYKLAFVLRNLPRLQSYSRLRGEARAAACQVLQRVVGFQLSTIVKAVRLSHDKVAVFVNDQASKDLVMAACAEGHELGRQRGCNAILYIPKEVQQLRQHLHSANMAHVLALGCRHGFAGMCTLEITWPNKHKEPWRDEFANLQEVPDHLQAALDPELEEALARATRAMAGSAAARSPTPTTAPGPTRPASATTPRSNPPPPKPHHRAQPHSPPPPQPPTPPLMRLPPPPPPPPPLPPPLEPPPRPLPPTPPLLLPRLLLPPAQQQHPAQPTPSK